MAGGRQRAFDETVVLDKATKLFWEKGYVGTSLSDLTLRMGINKPSMYAAFGNKEQLFIRSVDNYVDHYLSHQILFLQQDNKSTKGQLKDYLTAVVDMLTSEDNPKGCFVSLCIAESVNEDWPEQAKSSVNKLKNMAETVLTDFFTLRKSHNDFDQQPQIAAQFMVTVMHGLASMARAGKSKKQLMQVVNVALSNV